MKPAAGAEFVGSFDTLRSSDDIATTREGYLGPNPNESTPKEWHSAKCREPKFTYQLWGIAGYSEYT